MKAAETGYSPESAGKIQGAANRTGGMPDCRPPPSGLEGVPFRLSPCTLSGRSRLFRRRLRSGRNRRMNTRQKKEPAENSAGSLKKWSGKRDLNPRPPAWEASTLPLSYSRTGCRKILERETGFEPATSTMARLHSTTELLPQNEGVFITDSASRQAFFAKKENFFCRTRRSKALHRVRGYCTQQRLCCFSTCCVRIVRRVAPFFLVWGLSAVFVVVRLRREVNPA